MAGNGAKKSKEKKGGKLGYVFLGLMFFAGLAILSYPTVSDYWNSLHASRAILSYAEAVAGMTEEEYEALLQPARDYNANILQRGNPFILSEAEQAQYQSLLNIEGNGIIGYIEIPMISVTLPIYHGTGESVLQTAVGHLEWTSLPVGGESTHCVLSGHRGLPSARLFTDLDRLVVGDVFMISVLNQVLTYEVDQILIVLPEEISALTIATGEDLCTLVTCTPYGINTHRLLVRGHRIENTPQARSVRVTADCVQVEPLVVAPVVSVPLVVLALFLVSSNDKARRRAIDENEFDEEIM